MWLLAAELARRGQRVKVIDLDPQHSALDGLLETDRTKAMPE
jgi:cellulose biosynthesis protein BcsQ